MLFRPRSAAVRGRSSAVDPVRCGIEEAAMVPGHPYWAAFEGLLDACKRGRHLSGRWV